VADDRQPAERPASAESTPDASGERAGGAPESARPVSIPAQPTPVTSAPSTSRHERDRQAAEAAKPRRGRLANAFAGSKSTLSLARARIASAIWMGAVLAAVALSLGALLVALDANMDNALVSAVLKLDRAIDGPFWKVFDFYKETKSGAQGPPDDVKNHLVNWGLAAAGYLVVGRLLDRAIRPASR
jgi:hypothetical protein